jgi:hypothetical protein
VGCGRFQSEWCLRNEEFSSTSGVSTLKASWVKAICIIIRRARTANTPITGEREEESGVLCCDVPLSLRLEDLSPLVKLHSVTPKSGEARVRLQQMPEVRCLPKYVLANVDTSAWFNPRGVIECEVLHARLADLEAGYPVSISTLLGELGLETHLPHFERLRLHVEHFLDLFPFDSDPNRPLSASSPVAEELWPHIISVDADRERFREWIAQQNILLKQKFGGRIPRRAQEQVQDPKEALQANVPPSTETYGYQGDLQEQEIQQQQEKYQQQQEHGRQQQQQQYEQTYQQHQQRSEESQQPSTQYQPARAKTPQTHDEL